MSWIKEIILTEKQHDDLFSMIKGDWATVTKTKDDKDSYYSVRASDEEEFRGWRFRRNGSKKRIELWRYMAHDYELDNPKREKQLVIPM